MKRKNTIEDMTDRLYWYTYEADYGEYNDQEVNYIIDFLKKNNPIHEERIDRVAITYTLHKQDEPTKKPGKALVSRVISVLIAAASLIFTFSMSNESLAGLKIGAFNFLRRDKNGEKIIIVPEKSEPIIYKSYDELPSHLKNVLWDSGVSTEEYILEQISVDKDSGDIIVTYSDVKNEEGYFKIYYTDKILDDLKDMVVDYIVFYNGVKIAYYVDNDNTYRASFNMNDQFYCMESDNSDKVYETAHDLVDFVLDENKLVNR